MLFRKTPKRTTRKPQRFTQDTTEPGEQKNSVGPPTFTVQGMWTDTIGRLSIRSVQILIFGTLIACGVFGLLKLTLIVIPATIAIILACSLWPLVVKLRRTFSPMISAWIVFLGSLLVLGGVGTGLVISVVKEWSNLVNKAVEGFNQLSGTAQGFLGSIPFTLEQSQIDEAVNTVVAFLSSAKFGTGALNTLSAAGSFLAGATMLLLILFFLLKDGDRIWSFVVSWTPQHFHKRWILSGDRTLKTFGGYIRGTAIVATVDALGITITLLILQVPLALPLGVIVFLGSFVPMVGATAAGVLATLIALVTNGPVVALIVLAAVIVVNQLEGNFLQPVVMANALSLHPLVVLMGLTAGTVLGGIVGAVLSVPLTAAAWAVIKVWTGRDQMDVALIAGGTDRLLAKTPPLEGVLAA